MRGGRGGPLLAITLIYCFLEGLGFTGPTTPGSENLQTFPSKGEILLQ